MIEKPRENTSKKKLSWWHIALLFPFVCICCYFGTLNSEAIYFKWLDILAPNSKLIEISKPHLITSSLPPSIHELFWENNHVLLAYNSSENRETIVVDTRTGEIEHNLQHISAIDEDQDGLELYDGEEILGTCLDDNVVISGKEIERNKYEISLWKNDVVVADFSVISKQWSRYKLFSPFYSYGISPNCQYFYLVLHGQLDIDVEAQQELWLIDVSKETLQLLLKGRWFPYYLWNYPVQSVFPSWASDDQEFVFGDSKFGLEVYNMAKQSRHWVAGPSNRLAYPNWSSSGEWIASEQFRDQNNALVVISPVGKKMAVLHECSYISDFKWSPTGEKLAYICSEDTYSLWLWEFEK